MDQFRGALKKNPNYADAYKYLGLVNYTLGDYNEAKKNLDLAIFYNRGDYEAKLYLANNYRAKGEYNEAIAMYSNIIKDKPSYSDTYRELGTLYLMVNMFDASFDLLSKSDRLNTEDWKDYLAFGDYYYRRGNNAKAEEFYKMAFNITSPKTKSASPNAIISATSENTSGSWTTSSAPRK